MAWNEEDIIHATVRNLIDQGADRVFVVDDASDDETVSEARAAGADVLSTRNNGFYDEMVRAQKIEHVIEAQTSLAGGDVWWVIADADEFPRGPGGRTIRQLIQEVPPWVDVVGSRVLEHYPDSPDCYRVRTHPVRSMPLARWYHTPFCRSGHWKHQLVRVRQPGDLVVLPGHHTVAASDGRRVREYETSLLMHHVPIRNRERTEAKFRQAERERYSGSPDVYELPRILARLDMMTHLCEGRFDLIRNGFPGQPKFGIEVTDWRTLVPPEEADI